MLLPRHGMELVLLREQGLQEKNYNDNFVYTVLLKKKSKKLKALSVICIFSL